MGWCVGDKLVDACNQVVVVVKHADDKCFGLSHKVRVRQGLKFNSWLDISGRVVLTLADDFNCSKVKVNLGIGRKINFAAKNSPASDFVDVSSFYLEVVWQLD